MVLNKTFFEKRLFIPTLVLNPQAVCVNHLEEIWKDVCPVFSYQGIDFGKDIQLLDGSIPAFIA